MIDHLPVVTDLELEDVHSQIDLLLAVFEHESVGTLRRGLNILLDMNPEIASEGHISICNIHLAELDLLSQTQRVILKFRNDSDFTFSENGFAEHQEAVFSAFRHKSLDFLSGSRGDF